MKLRYWLPASQTIVALILLRLSEEYYKTVSRIVHMPGPAVSSRVLSSINAPVVVPRALWFHFSYSSAFWNEVFILVAVALLWYLVALNIDCWRERRRVLMFASLPLRVLADFLLILIGAFLALRFVADILSGLAYRTSTLWMRLAALEGPVVAWAIVLVGFFGRDLVLAFKQPAPATVHI